MPDWVDPSIVVSIGVFAFLLYRLRQVRPVPRTPRLRSSLIIGVLGIVSFGAALGNGGGKERIEPKIWLVLLASFLVGASLGVVRAHTVRLSFVDRRLMRQGTWLTVGLWLVAVLLHAAAGPVVAALGGPSRIVAASGMLYLAMASAVQQVVVVRRGRQRRQAARAALAAREAREAS